jgi:hypothetical protein
MGVRDYFEMKEREEGRGRGKIDLTRTQRSISSNHIGISMFQEFHLLGYHAV